MNIWHLRNQPKDQIDLGRWRTEKMTKSAFPMSRSKSKAYRLGINWRWRLITFNASGTSYRLLAAYRADKEQFQAWLGEDTDSDTKLVARLEFHGTHPGWHIHYASEPMKNVPSGIRQGPWVRRKSCGPAKRHNEFGYSSREDFDNRSMTMVAEVFGLNSSEGGLL